MDRKISRNVYNQGENHYTEWLKIRKMLNIQDDKDDKIIWSQEAVVLTIQNLFRLDSYEDVDD
jgi:hypothetical protein